jgi:hypothetical protein
MSLKAAPVDAFAVATDFADAPGGLLIDDVDEETQEWSYSIVIDQDCAQPTDKLALLEAAFAEPLARGEADALGVNPCGESGVSVASKALVLELSRSAALILALDGDESVGVRYSTVEESTGRRREWSVALERFSPEVGDLLDVLYASNAVVACELLTSNTLRVSLAEGESAQPIEQLIEDSGLPFATVLVGSDL